jgi:hypothetical protein
VLPAHIDSPPAMPVRPQRTRLADCSWSFFGDPRALAHGRKLLTACVSSAGRPVLVRADTRTRRHTVTPLFGRMERDDHNNPSLVFWHKRLWAFSSPHSGHTFPRDRHMYVHFRVSKKAYGLTGGFHRLRDVPLPKGCGLGYTYPNPVVYGKRLYLFLRGPCLQPIYTWTADGRHWARARTLVLGQRRAGGGWQRPYAKYAAGRRGIAMVFTEGHPYSIRTSLFYMRMRGGRFYRADGSLLGTVRDLPFRATQLDPIYRYAVGSGRAWPMDVALAAGDRPVVVYTRATGHGDYFWYARWDGAWRNELVMYAGGRYGGYLNGGASLRHEDPTWLALGANSGDYTYEQVQLLHTDDGGTTWMRATVPDDPGNSNFRPVFPRGLPASGPVRLEWVDGQAPDFRHYHTHLVMAG